MKICSKCGQLLDESCFGKRKDTKDGLFYQCKNCRREYYQNNRQTLLEKQKEHYQNNRETRIEYQNEYHQRPEVKEQLKEYYKTPQFKIRNRLNNKKRKISRQLAFEAHGYTDKEVAMFLIKRDNLIDLSDDLHLDHIIPFSLFDNNSEIGRYMCWDLSNLRFIPAKYNLSKHDKLEEGWEEQLLTLTLKSIWRKK